MSIKRYIEAYSLEQKIVSYKLYSDVSYSYRIRDRDNKLISCCQVFGSCCKEPVFFKPYFNSNEIQFKMETEVKLFSTTYHLFCTTKNDFFAYIKRKIGGTWQIFYSGDREPCNIVFSRDIIKKGFKAIKVDKTVYYALIRDKKILGMITRERQNEIKQNKNIQGYSSENFKPAPCILMLKLKPEALKLDPRALWAAIVVLQEYYEINLLPPIPLI